MTLDEQVAVVRRALDAGEAGDADAYLACLADDVVLELPYASAEGGTRLDKAGIARMVTGVVFRNFATRSFSIDRVFGTDDGTALAIEYGSELVSRVGDGHYENRYVGVFEFRAGLITRWREYANPLTFAAAMAAVKKAASS
ncbi:MAG TPA: nuclear transport factor 2 family protein [Acidimicrobiia bacterium]|nr:nuclear transport factor 2 family protein [Acidimicrobiia bacterium]